MSEERKCKGCGDVAEGKLREGIWICWFCDLILALNGH
jgi:ribosomal protein L37AE/L43A